MGTSISLFAATVPATVWNAICSYPVHCASWADMKFVNSYLDIRRYPSEPSSADEDSDLYPPFY